MKVLVTGSSGRFGPYVVSELAAAGHDLVLFDLLEPQGAAAKRPWVRGDIRSLDDCRKALQGGFDAVMHLAAQPWPTDHPRQQERREREAKPLDLTMSANIIGTYQVLHAALLAGVKRFVMTSTNCVMGHIFRISNRPYPCKRLPLDESQPQDVEDSYSFSKLTCERMLELYSRVYGMRTYALRCAGLCDETARRRYAENAAPVQKWDWGLWAWVSREDAAAAHRLVMEKADSLPRHDAFLCNADDTTALEPTMEIIEKFRPDLLSLVEEKLEGRASLMSNRKLKNAVGWEHRHNWRDYLEPSKKG